MPRRIFSYFLFLVLVTAVSSSLGSRGRSGSRVKGDDALRGVLVLDGSNVHDVGNLDVHVGNWGLYGSLPGSGNTFSFAPSAEWPAGSGIEYLYGVGLWVGALKQGVPAVSTSHFETEFRPTQDPIDILYRSFEGAPGGNRYPSLNADDDGDGAVDEDWLNGRNDDVLSDSQVDEDYAAISDQMFSCAYSDVEPIAQQVYPNHNPLGIKVRQESYQWHDGDFDDFVGIEYTITNTGNDVLQDVYVGVFADPDCGQRDNPNYWEDDATDYLYVPVRCTDYGPAEVRVAYGYDADGDQGQTPGYFGVALLGHTTDPTGINAPRNVKTSAYRNFYGSASFANGGDPTNDFERYEALSSETIQRGGVVPRDYRMLIVAGPFEELPPGNTVKMQVALVVGAGLGEMVEHAARAQLTYDGAWFDLDGNSQTGVDKRETAVFGPATVAVDTCRPELSNPINVPANTVMYVNNDCQREQLFKQRCVFAEADSFQYATGVGGREYQVHWCLPEAPDEGPSVVSNWTFDEGTGNTAFDYVGDNDGSIKGAAQYHVNSVCGFSIFFDGRNDYVEVPDHPTLDFTNELTIEAWIFPFFGAADTRYVVDKGVDGGVTGNGVVYSLDIFPGKVRAVLTDTDNFTRTATGTTDILESVWQHIAVTWDGAEIKVFYNGVKEGSRSFIGTLATSPAELLIGRYGGLHWSGMIDEVAIHNRGLTEAEIMARYQSSLACQPVPVFFTSFDATPRESGMQLDWDVFADEDFEGFRIYRRQEGQTRESLISQPQLDSEARRYFDRDVEVGMTYQYVLTAVMLDGEEIRSSVATASPLVGVTRLRQNHPNPFNPSTTIEYSVAEPVHVDLVVYDAHGRRVTALVNNGRAAGSYVVEWNGTDAKGNAVASGVYFYRMKVGTRTHTRKMILLK